MKKFQAGWDNPGAPSRLQIVFEGRNKSYGAYELRAAHERRLLIAFMCSIGFFAILTLLPSVLHLFKGNPPEKVGPDHSGEYEFMDAFVPPPAPAPRTLPSKSMAQAGVWVVRDIDSIPDKPDSNAMALTGTGQSDAKADSISGSDQPPAVDGPAPDTELKDWTYVEEMPVFPGGDAALLRYLQEHLRYPATALREGIEGTVYVGFVINREGRVEKINVRNYTGGGLEEEAVRVISAMPLWTPGKQNGKAVNVQYGVPVKFKIR